MKGNGLDSMKLRVFDGLKNVLDWVDGHLSVRGGQRAWWLFGGEMLAYVHTATVYPTVLRGTTGAINGKVERLIGDPKFYYFLSQAPLIITRQRLLPIAVIAVNNGEVSASDTRQIALLGS